MSNFWTKRARYGYQCWAAHRNLHKKFVQQKPAKVLWARRKVCIERPFLRIKTVTARFVLMLHEAHLFIIRFSIFSAAHKPSPWYENPFHRVYTTILKKSFQIHNILYMCALLLSREREIIILFESFARNSGNPTCEVSNL